MVDGYIGNLSSVSASRYTHLVVSSDQIARLFVDMHEICHQLAHTLRPTNLILSLEHV